LAFALYAIARAAFERAYSHLIAALGGLSLAAAFASRPQLVLAAGALLWLLVLGEKTARERLIHAVIALIPFAAGFALVLVYNYVRFDSPFEFGIHYMLAGVNVRKTHYFESGASRLATDLQYSLLKPPRLRSTFPFVTLVPAPPDSEARGIEVVAGIIWVAPLVLLIGAAPRVWRKIEGARRLEWAWCGGTLVLLGAAWIVVDATFAATMRYEADFATVLLLSAALVIMGWARAGTMREGWWFLRAVVALGVLGILVNGAIGMTGYNDNFRVEAPEQYERTAALFTPVAKALEALGIPP